MTLDKSQIKYITQNIQPDEAEYVLGVSALRNQAANIECCNPNCNPIDLPEEILLLNQLLQISNKMIDVQVGLRSQDYRYLVQDFQWALKDFIENFAKYIRLAYGIEREVVMNINLPVSSDPIDQANTVKDILNNYITQHKDSESAEYRVIVEKMKGLLVQTLDSIYKFRLASLDAKTAQGAELVVAGCPEPRNIECTGHCIH